MPEDDLLVPLDQYLAAGVHIGTPQREESMRKFIYNIRPDGLSVFNVQMIDSRIRAVAKFLAKFPKESVIAVSTRESGKKAANKFAQAIGTKEIFGRFMPGSLTNPRYSEFMEPKVLLVTDPNLDVRAIKEGLLCGIPVIAFCDTNNTTSYVDFVIPGNNKGRKAIALLWYLLAREVLRERGELAKDAEPSFKVEEFVSSLSDISERRPSDDLRRRGDRDRDRRGGRGSDRKGGKGGKGGKKGKKKR